MLTSLSTPRSEKGQALLIVILFLLFIAMIIIVGSRVMHSDKVQNQFANSSSSWNQTVNTCSSSDIDVSTIACDLSSDR